MLRILSVVLLHFTCTFIQAKEDNGAKTTEIIFSIPSHKETDGKQKHLTESEKTKTEKDMRRHLKELGLSAQSTAWTDQGELKLILPPLGEAVRQDFLRELTKKKLVRYGNLTLNLVHPQSRSLAPEMAADPKKVIPQGYVLKMLIDEDQDGKIFKEPILIWKNPVLDNTSIKHAQELYAPHEGKVSIELNTKGATKMSDATSKMRHGSDRLAIILDGKILSAPTVQSSLGAKFEISGMKNAAEAKKIAVALLSPQSNTLEVKSINPPLAK